MAEARRSEEGRIVDGGWGDSFGMADQGGCQSAAAPRANVSRDVTIIAELDSL